MSFRVAICDDNPTCLAQVEQIVNQYHRVPVQTKTFQSPEELLTCTESFDLIILDIDMPKMNGIDTAKKIREKDKVVKIIYLTSYSDYTLFAFEVHAFAYLLKPVKETELHQQLDELIDSRQLIVEAEIEFQTQEGVLRIACNDIYYFEYQNRFVAIHTLEGIHIMKGRIADIAASMKPHHFEMPHKSFVVNLYYVKSIRGYDITMMDGSVLPLSQKKSVQFRKELNLYLGQERR